MRYEVNNMIIVRLALPTMINLIKCVKTILFVYSMTNKSGLRKTALLVTP